MSKLCVKKLYIYLEVQFSFLEEFMKRRERFPSQDNHRLYTVVPLAPLSIFVMFLIFAFTTAFALL